MCGTMHNSVIYLCTLLLSGAVFVIATNNDEVTTFSLK